MSVNSFSGQPAIPASYGFTAGKNKIINGDFGIWQRGTSFTNPADASYTADRFEIRQDGNGTKIISQQTFTPGTAPVAGYEGQYFFRWNDSVAGSTQTFKVVSQKIEDVRTFAGQTVTVSFWAKADAARTVTYYLMQLFGSGGSADVSTSSNSASLTTSWQRFTATISVPSISGKTIGTGSSLRLRFDLPLNVAQTLDIWGVQVEAGATATSFQTATGTIQGELAACQRYYYRANANAQTTDAYFFNGSTGSYLGTTVMFGSMLVPVTLRIPPSAIEYGGSIYVAEYGNGWAVTSMAIDTGGTTKDSIAIAATVASGLTGFRPYYVRGNSSSSAYIAVSAEL